LARGIPETIEILRKQNEILKRVRLEESLEKQRLENSQDDFMVHDDEFAAV
jgi:hypothetical protein